MGCKNLMFWFLGTMVALFAPFTYLFWNTLSLDDHGTP